jgi:hypothetical protein
VYTLHVVTKVPVAGKAISGHTSLATFIGAEERFVAVSMHGVGFTLMAEEASSGREIEGLTSSDLAVIWLEVRIHEFTGTHEVVSMEAWDRGMKMIILIVALQLLGLVLAIGLSFPWAVVKSIGSSGHIVVQWMIPGSVVNLKCGTSYKSERFLRSLGS